MMTTKKRRRNLPALAVIALAGTLLTACSPPGGRDLRKGESDINAGQFDAAIEPLNDATRVLSSAPPAVQSKAWNLLGLAYHGAGQLDAASQAYLRALKLDHNYEAVDFNLGCLRMEQSNYPGAIDYFTTCITLNPRGADGYLKLGAARYHMALEQTGAERVRQMENARHDFEVAEKVHPTAEGANAIGMMEFQRRNGGMEAVRAAATQFQTALARDPQYGPALLNLAIVDQQYLKQIPKALQLYLHYLALQPPPPHAKEVATLAHQLDLETRITIGPDTGERPAPTPRVIIVPSNPTPATPKTVPAENPTSRAAKPAPAPAPTSESQIAAVSTISPAPPPTPPPKPAPTAPASAPPSETPSSVTNVTPADNLAAGEIVAPPPASPQQKTLAQKINPLHWFAGKSKTSAQTPPVPKGPRYTYPPPVTPIPGNGAEAERFAALGAQAGRKGHLREAVRDYRQATAADPTYFDASLSLGLTAIDAGDYPVALEALYRALALEENSANARYAFAWALQKRGYYIDAAAELEKLLAAHPDDVRGHLLLGNLEAEKLGRPKDARQHYARVLELDPANSQAPAIRAWILSAP
ncbi:MAG TPA: tetratricopeptide repeat protein [Candidatus Baltobacteraceae bacterium]|jgi:tetratricopeptide (TPR) repeat protein|nr:tetratricopeptide repeat protein [Candidatus Baltobacteraceae bacterium]